MNSGDWILPKGYKGSLHDAGQQKKTRNQHNGAGGFLEDAGEYGQSVGDIGRRIAHHICLIHISHGVSEPWVVVFTVGSRKS
jgi:hypothetical protein